MFQILVQRTLGKKKIIVWRFKRTSFGRSRYPHNNNNQATGLVSAQLTASWSQRNNLFDILLHNYSIAYHGDRHILQRY